MQTAYLHVVINHLPIMGVPIALALLALGAWARSEPVQRAALLLFVGLALATVAVYLAGQGGEEFVEHLPGVSEDAIEAHEAMAGIALGAMGVLGALSLWVFVTGGGVGLLTRRESPRRVSAAGVVLVLVAGAATAAILGYTGKLGGQIRHVEFAGMAIDANGEDDDADDRGRRGRGRH